jgi:hypothetical protein
MKSFRGQLSWAKMTSPGGKPTALACYLTKKVSKAEKLTYLSTNIDYTYLKARLIQTKRWHCPQILDKNESREI